ncbi:MAG TPA: hypothetical protein ENN06_08040 [Desulfobacteraceae bacterium]|nr:hypothetical protein [Desulfobacteraceae bacterium]
MKEIILPPQLTHKLVDIYREMESRYTATGRAIGLTCTGCPDNCCDSYFLHYTYVEWAYLWVGLRTLDQARLDEIANRAKHYIEQRRAVPPGTEPALLMCPLNEEGRCVLYGHRLMICRLHGVPAIMTRPDGRTLRFPGCFRCQQIMERRNEPGGDQPSMQRTDLLARMADLESELLDGRRHVYPRVRRTIAEMIAGGPPMVDKPFCER